MKTQVLIIGGGATGTGVARDLALRGIACVLVEKNDINAGASGGNHGLLHSGARYVSSDPAAARECREEGQLLKQLAPQCVEDTGGLFVAVEGDDETYITDFPNLCAQAGIPARPLEPLEARAMEPALSANLIAAFYVEDAAIDPFKLSLDNLAHAQQLGTRYMSHNKVESFSLRGHHIQSIHVRNVMSGQTSTIEADVVVNAAGAWAGAVAQLAGATIGMLYSKGSLLVTQNRLSQRVINRLRNPTDADILVPGGTVSILGTTSVRCDSPDVIYPEIDEVDLIIEEGAAMMPSLASARYIRAYCGVRPLISMEDNGDDRSVTRGFELFDHADAGIDNFITITGGKLTTFRLMAEKTADLVCERLGVCNPCRTREEPLPATLDAKWTEPGLAPRLWMRQQNSSDLLLCECEMVPQSTVDSISASLGQQGETVTLKGIGVRSRVGKGPCQGTFCSQRVAAHFYDQGRFSDDQGLQNLREFLGERWRGQHPLLWGMPLVQFELQEALHCGLFGLELPSVADLEQAP